MTCNVLLVGYGAVGVVMTYALEKTGKVNVTAVARSNYQTVCDGKMVLKSEQHGDIHGLKPFRGEVTVSLAGQSQSVRKLSDLAAVTRTVTEAADQPYDYVVITTKAIPELYPTSELVAPLLSLDYRYPQPIYVLMQNGLGVEKDLHAALQEKESTRSAKIITGAIYITTSKIGDTVFHSDRVNRFLGNFYRGEDGSLATNSSHEESFHRLVDLLNQGGCEAKADPHPQAVKFRKNLWNASLVMLSCLTRTPCHVLFNDELASQGATSTLHTIVTELVTIGKASGYPSEYLTDPTQLIEHGRKHHEDTAGYKPSTLLDVEAGRPFELEVILGEVVRQGKKFNVPIPTLEIMYNTLNIVQRQFVLAAAKK